MTNEVLPGWAYLRWNLAAGAVVDNELLDADVNKFDDVRHAVPPIRDPRRCTRRRSAPQPRYRKLYARLGTNDELRVSFVASRTPVGVGVFVRNASGRSISCRPRSAPTGSTRMRPIWQCACCEGNRPHASPTT